MRRKFKNIRTPSANKLYRVNDEDSTGNTDDGNAGDEGLALRVIRIQVISVRKLDSPRRKQNRQKMNKQNVTDLNDEMKKEKPSKRVLKSLMNDTFAVRRKWIMVDNPSVQDVLVCACACVNVCALCICGAGDEHYGILLVCTQS